MPTQRGLKGPIYTLLLLVSLWLALFLLRPVFYHPSCALNPSICSPDKVNFFDQITFHYSSVLADYWSNVLQNSVATLVFLFPLFFFRKEPKKAVFLIIFMMLVTSLNGVFLELTRTFVQRPRPLVLLRPTEEGAQLHQYTSFYSGHTSFVAAATFATYLWFKALVSKMQKTQKALLFLYFTLTLLTAVLRVWGGRHYPTDTLGGWLAGTAVATLAFNYLRPKLI